MLQKYKVYLMCASQQVQCAISSVPSSFYMRVDTLSLIGFSGRGLEVRAIVKKAHGTHFLDADDPQEPQEEEPEDGDDDGALDILFENEAEGEEDDEGMMDDEEGEEYCEEELKEILAAGWKANQDTRAVDIKKKSGAGLSCGKLGHW